MPSYVSNGQLFTAAGHPTGLAAPSVPLANYGAGAYSLVGGRTVSFAELYRSQVWVAICVHKISRQLSRLPLKVYRRTDQGRERLRAGYLAELLDEPWPGGSPIHFKQAASLPVLVHGGGMFYKRRRPRAGGRVRELVPVMWGSLEAVRDEGGEVREWHTSQPGLPRVLEPRDVIHLGHRGLEGPLGVSPLEQLGVTVRIEDAAQRHQQALLRNGARPPSALEVSNEFLTNLEQTERQTLMDNLRSDVDMIYVGPDQQGKPAVLPPGVTWNAVGHTAVEAELIAQRRLTREEVAACYDIPPPLVGILEHATLANVEEYQRMLYTTILAPWLVLIEECLGTQLIAMEPTLRGDVYVEFDLSEVLRGDLLKRAQALALQIGNGIMTIDEAREAENRPTFGMPETTRPLYPANNLKPVGMEQQAPPTDAQVQDAATALAGMSEDDLRSVLRSYDFVTDAVVAIARQRRNGHAAPNGVSA